MTADNYRQDLEPSLHSSVLWALNKGTNDPALRSEFAKITAAYVPGCDLLSGQDVSASSRQVGGSIERDGCAHLKSSLSEDAVKDITSYFSNVTETEQDKTLTYYKIPDIFHAPHLLDIACDPEILAAVGSYLNVAPTILDLSAWWTRPVDTIQIPAQVPHRDRDDFKFCKLFVYLTDVGPDDGPHLFLPGSHTKMGMEALCRRRGVDLNLIKNAFETNSRHQASWIVNNFQDDWLEFTGAAGTMFFVNTFGYHYGKLPRKSPRLIFQVLYGQMGYGHRAERLRQTHALTLSEAIKSNPLSRYACRLMGEGG